MNNSSIRFACAVNHNGLFEAKHFGNADKYLIYEWNNGDFNFIKEVTNSYNNFDDIKLNGLSTKNMACINLLEQAEVKILVSRQFGQNVQMINKLFIPVVVNSETPEEVVSILKKHIRWIEEELNSHPEEFKLFSINKGILKTKIRKNLHTSSM
jgi:predicted Fe-Mo cluster-binding NifX family protein